MTIKNLEALTTVLVDWCREKAADAGAEGAVVGVSGGVDSAVTLALCARAFPRKTIGVMMPCHSSPSSIERGKELIDSLGDAVFCQTIQLEGAFDCIANQFNRDNTWKNSFDDNFAFGALRSCLRAPTLDFIAKTSNALVFGTGNRDEDEIFRYYQKRGDGAVDNNVLACLHKSEVWELAKHLGVPESIVSAVPSADLWGAESNQTDESELGISYEEIEWATRENDRYNFMQATAEPEEVVESFMKVCGLEYTERQKQVLVTAIKAERSTRHKAEAPPGPSREQLSNLGLVE